MSQQRGMTEDGRGGREDEAFVVAYTVENASVR